MTITIQTYDSMDAMPPAVRKAVRTMGDTSCVGHLRKVAMGHDDFQFKQAIVLLVDGVPKGWAVLYRIDVTWSNDYHAVSVWVRTRDRGNGYGNTLIDMAFDMWHKHSPIVYHSVKEKWALKTVDGFSWG